MSDAGIRFPEYGDGGDRVGSRRSRHAFRLCVAFIVFFTWMLWFAEHFLRYEHTEMLYLRALTQEPFSARPFLRQAVKIDERNREIPTPKYLQALASIEEDDLVLQTYERAYELDKENATLAVRYGCRLLASGHVAEARDRFREAGRSASDNATPLYLEASTLPWLEEDHDLRGSLGLIAKANGSGRKVTLPKPLWFSGIPQSGYWYADRRRRIVKECAAPLRRYVDLVTSQADEALEQGKVQYWDLWLEKVEVMGRRIAEGAVDDELTGTPFLPGAALQARTGVDIQLRAARLRERVTESSGGGVDKERVERRLRLESAERLLASFEEVRADRVAAERAKYLAPNRLAAEGIGVLMLVYMVAYVLAKLWRTGKRAWTLPHSTLGKVVLAGGAAGVFALLTATIPCQQLAGGHLGWIPVVQIAWEVLLGTVVVFGLFYPALRLQGAGKTAMDVLQANDRNTVLKASRQARRIAYVSFLRRYYGVALGLMSGAVCAWILLYRILVSVYPWQIKLLAAGLAEEETALVRAVIQGLL